MARSAVVHTSSYQMALQRYELLFTFCHSPTKFVLDSTTFLYVLVVVAARLRHFVFIIVEAIAKCMNQKSTHSFR